MGSVNTDSKSQVITYFSISYNGQRVISAFVPVQSTAWEMLGMLHNQNSMTIF